MPGDQAGGVDALAALLPALLGEVRVVQELHHRVVLVDQLPLGGPAHQFLQGRLQHLGRMHHQVVHRRGREGHAQVLLEPGEPGVGHAGAEPEQGHHGRYRLVVFLGAHPLGGQRGEALAAAVAAQRLPLDHLGLQGRHAHDPHHHCRLGLGIEPALEALRAAVARPQGGVRHLDPLGSGERLRSLGPIAGLGFLGLTWRLGLARLRGEQLPGGLGGRAESQRPEAADAGPLGLDLLVQPAHRRRHPADRGGILGRHDGIHPHHQGGHLLRGHVQETSVQHGLGTRAADGFRLRFPGLGTSHATDCAGFRPQSTANNS